MTIRTMEIKDWMVGLAIALSTGLIAWGAMEANVGSLKSDMEKMNMLNVPAMKNDVADIKTWKDAAIEKMGNMDGKLDALLTANGVEYKPKGRNR